MTIESKIPVIYIVSHGRSGSTLVGSVLGLVEGYVYVGEIRDVWRDGLIDNQSCGCGAKFRDCPFWIEVFRRAFGGFETLEVNEAARRINRMTKLPDTFSLFRLAWTFPSDCSEIEEYTRPLAKLYRAIQEVSGAEVIIDSSKTMRYGALVAATPGLKVLLVNLIRDPRAIVQSRVRPARHRDGSLKPPAIGYGRYRVAHIIAKWAVRNALAARVLRRDGGVRLIYEDFVKDQSQFLTAVAGKPGADVVVALIKSGIPSNLVQHQVAGNWVRGLKITAKETWRQELPWFPRVLATIFSAPFRAWYRASDLLLKRNL